MTTQKSIEIPTWDINGFGNAVDIASVIANSTVVVRQTATNGTTISVYGLTRPKKLYDIVIIGVKFAYPKLSAGISIINVRNYTDDQLRTLMIQNLGLRGLTPDCWTLEFIRREE